MPGVKANYNENPVVQIIIFQTMTLKACKEKSKKALQDIENPKYFVLQLDYLAVQMLDQHIRTHVIYKYDISWNEYQ
eukprot:4344113-Ditylum_brightwellii.AAC.1